jgi:hypothetical protein
MWKQMEIEINNYTGRISTRKNVNFPRSLRIKGAGEIFSKVINLGFNKVSVPKVFVKICRVVLGDKIAKFSFIYTFHPEYIFAIGKEFKNEIQKFMKDPYEKDPVFIFGGLLINPYCPKTLEAYFSSTEIKVDAAILGMCMKYCSEKSEAEIIEILDVLAKFSVVDELLRYKLNNEQMEYLISRYPEKFTPENVERWRNISVSRRK